MKIKELRDMSLEHLDLVLKETKDKLFRLRAQARMERLDSPSELNKNKRLIARILTLKKEIAAKATQQDKKTATKGK